MSAALSDLFMQIPAGMEWIFIIIVIGILIFGVKKIPELARTFGKAGAEYEKSKLEAKRELQKIRSAGEVDREKLEEVADSLGIDYSDKDDGELKSAIDRKLKESSKKDTGSLPPDANAMG